MKFLTRYSLTSGSVARRAECTVPTVNKYRPALDHIVLENGVALFTQDAPQTVKRLKAEAIRRRGRARHG